MLAAVHFSTTINLGAIVASALVIASAGYFTIRSKVAAIWRESYEGERQRNEQLIRELGEQRELGNKLKDDLNALRLATDLTGHQKFMAELMKGLTENSTGRISKDLHDAETRIIGLCDSIHKTQKAQTLVLKGIAESLNGNGHHPT